MDEETKAWLGFNLQDGLITAGSIPFFIGLFFSDLLIVLILFGIAVVFMVWGMYVYFTRQNPRLHKNTVAVNKWGSLILVVLIALVMVVKVGMLLIIK